MIFDEPVRGRTAPAWFWALPGIERLHLMGRRLLPLPPIAHLLGVRAGHVGPGSGTWTMPASTVFETEVGSLDTAPLQETALVEAAISTLPAGMDVEPITISVNYFRPTRPQAGNLLARARVINASRFFLFCEAELEDSQGRRIAHASSHLAIRRIEPLPPPPPPAIQSVEEPVYGTADPYLRKEAGTMPPLATWQENDGDTVMQMFAAGTFVAPYQRLLPVAFEAAGKGRVVISMPASEWLCRHDRTIAFAGLASLTNRAGWYAGLTMPARGQSLVALDQATRLYRSVPADGRKLRAEGRAELRNDGMVAADVMVHDADGRLVATASSIGVIVENAQRQRRQAPEAKRILAALLFTDVVGSTELADRLGDTGWRALLEEHRRLIRIETARHGGTEVQTTGDGFLIRFETSLRAIECARACHASIAHLGVRLRAGIHAGECDLQAGNVSGVCVHIAARVQALAPPGETLVSSTVHDLAIGSGVPFEEFGVHSLKGVPGEWRLYVAGR